MGSHKLDDVKEENDLGVLFSVDLKSGTLEVELLHTRTELCCFSYITH